MGYTEPVAQQGKIAKRNIHPPISSGEGEGVVVGIVRERLSGGEVGIALDFTGAPVPGRRFSADAGWVAVGTDVVRILFAQFKAAGPEIEHVVVLRLPFSGVRLFIHSMKRVSVAAHGYLEKVNNAPSPKVDRESLPDQTFTMDANIIIAGFSGREACMDLYHSSPQVKVALKRGSNEFRAEPIARVTLTTRLMIDIHDELAAKVAELPQDEHNEVVIEEEADE